jgi:site-specific DNA-methyltransferase (adenine-specific)
MTTPYTVHTGDCRDVLRDYPADHFDSIVSDPPYGLTFMGKGWDRGVPGVEFWQEALRVAKPGAHLLAFGGTRTFHRLTVAIEDAGWEIRDCMMWLYGSGFPKSHDVSKAIDRAAGAEREVIGTKLSEGGRSGSTSSVGQHLIDAGRELPITAPATDDARAWQGWGTALKPAWEPVIVARKPLSGTVADNVLRYGTGALNIDGCRVGAEDGDYAHPGDLTKRPMARVSFVAAERGDMKVTQAPPHPSGRWPANVMHDGSAEVVAGFPHTTSGNLEPHHRLQANDNLAMSGANQARNPRASFGGDSGSAARFFYCAKASRTDREEGCDHLPARSGADAVERDEGSAGLQSPRAGAGRTADTVRNFHPTVKPTDLMRYLCRLVTPPAGLVLDPFCGSGSTGKAALLEGLRFVGVDLDPAHVAIAEARCQFAVDTVAEQAAAAEAPGAQLTLF